MMALEEYIESEVIVAVAATAALLSPRVRGVVRRGAVYGLAGVLMARDAIASAVTASAHDSDGSAAEATEDGHSSLSSLPRRRLVSGLATVMTLADTISLAVRDARSMATNVVQEVAGQVEAETSSDIGPSSEVS